VLGIAYKKNVDDMRESPSFKLLELLKEKGAIVDYNDPHIPKIPKLRHYSFDMSSVPLTVENILRYDAVLIATDHSDYDYPWIGTHAKLIIDTRNAMKVGLSNGKVVKA
jgi:UDP-N-acetyl-D-glucosamine dehydrogenase